MVMNESGYRLTNIEFLGNMISTPPFPSRPCGEILPPSDLSALLEMGGKRRLIYSE